MGYRSFIERWRTVIHLETEHFSGIIEENTSRSGPDRFVIEVISLLPNRQLNHDVVKRYDCAGNSEETRIIALTNLLLAVEELLKIGSFWGFPPAAVLERFTNLSPEEEAARDQAWTDFFKQHFPKLITQEK